MIVVILWGFWSVYIYIKYDDIKNQTEKLRKELEISYTRIRQLERWLNRGGENDGSIQEKELHR